jgi:hypothetical protein
MKVEFRHALLSWILIASPALAHPSHTQLVAPVDSPAATEGERQWLAGDHHIHSEFSASYSADPANPAAIPTPLFGKDGRYSIRKNAEMARSFGLTWMVSTDHGGPNHSKINHDVAYPSLLEARRMVPEVLQFYGMEFDTPNGDHSSLIIPQTAGERQQLFDIEKGYSQRDTHPKDPTGDEPARMIAALKAMKAQPFLPVLFANHPSRSAANADQYGRYDPAEFRSWNDTAPKIAVGMEGAPGHQAGAFNPDGSLNHEGRRGGYRRVPTMGGFDPMTARLGGLWDSLLSEGRRWWVTATSDSHSNWRDGGNDFWPGEYSKTYVLARGDYGDIIDGLREGRIFVTTGDLVSSVEVKVSGSRARGKPVGLGEELVIRGGEDVTVEIRVRDPQSLNSGGQNPQIKRIDLIAGVITGPNDDRGTDRAPHTKVIRRFFDTDWHRETDVLVMQHRIAKVQAPLYLRLRGTSGGELEPADDPAGENPWNDLWFYANPIFVRLEH